MLQVLVEEVPADSLGGDGELAVGQMTDEVVNGVPCRPPELACPEGYPVCDNSKKRGNM